MVQLHNPSSALLEEDHWAGSEELETKRILGLKATINLIWFSDKGTYLSSFSLQLEHNISQMLQEWSFRQLTKGGKIKSKREKTSDNSFWHKGRHNVYIWLTCEVTLAYLLVKMHIKIHKDPKWRCENLSTALLKLQLKLASQFKIFDI